MATIFVADLSSEAEGLSVALRAAGHTVVDVPPSMLVARVAVQRPRVVLVDADADGALEVVERMRELPEADDIHVLFIGRAGGVIASPEEALAHEGSGLFLRPVEIPAIVQKVQTLTMGARIESAALPLRAPPTPLPTSKAASGAPSLPPASMRASVPPNAPESQSSAPPSPRSSRSPSEPPAAIIAGVSPRRFMSLAPPVSTELQELLAEAEQRVQVQAERELIVPSPEDEIEAVLPADMLAALDEPLDEDEDDEDPVVPSRYTSHLAGRDRTSIRGGARASRTGTSPGTSAMGNPAPPARTTPGARPSETAPAHTQGGTHSGPTGDSISTTGGSDVVGPSDAAPRVERISPPSDPRDHSERAPQATSSAWLQAAATNLPGRDSLTPAGATEAQFPTILGPGDAMRVVARAIAVRTTSSLCIGATDDGGAAGAPPRGQRAPERRIVLREGDVVTASSTSDDESLLAFLGVRGDLPRETVRRLASKFPPFGRHAAAALVARGYIRQDQMWPTLRAHAEWLFARAMQTPSGRLAVEATATSGRPGGEPSVFGGSTGAAVFVEVVRRIIPPAVAIERLGGLGSRVAEGSEIRLLGECALDPAEVAQVHSVPGRPLRDLVGAAPDGDLATVIFALTQLGVLDVMRISNNGTSSAEDSSAPDVTALDAEAVRERVRARLQLVEDGDYFALLGVSRDATGYEVRRAFLELRRAFDPSRLPTSEVSDLLEDCRKIASVLEEAYEILKDTARRERYRRAIEAVPDR